MTGSLISSRNPRLFINFHTDSSVQHALLTNLQIVTSDRVAITVRVVSSHASSCEQYRLKLSRASLTHSKVMFVYGSTHSCRVEEEEGTEAKMSYFRVTKRRGMN